MDKIEFSLSKTKFKYLMKSIFTGETCSQLICTNCNSIRNRFEELLFLSLEMRNMNRINQCLDKYINEEMIDDFFCEKCNQKTRHRKRISINKLPNILFIHLQRFSFNYETFSMEKINSTLEFPRRINFKNYCTESINENIEENENLKNDNEFNNKVYNHNDNYYKYKLKGIVVHSGTAQFGHYYSLINVNMNDISDNCWLRFDDSIVTKYDINKLKEDTFGGDFSEKNEWFPQRNNMYEENSRSAYILVYERNFKSPIMELVDYNLDINDKNNIIDIGDNYDFYYKSIDPFRKENEDKNSLKLDCENKPILINEKMNDETIYKYKNEYFKYTPYYSLSCNVKYDQDFYDEVIKDNITFRNDKNIFNIYFEQFINSLINNLISQIQFSDEKFSDENLNLIIKSIHHILVDILTKIIDKSNINNIIMQLIEIIKIKPSITKIILEEFLKDKEFYIYKLILTLDDKLNSFFQNYLTESIRYALIYDTNEYYSLVNQVFDYLLSLIPFEISKNWTKMICYLDIFDQLLNLNNQNNEIQKKIIRLFYEKDLITKFGDLFL
jgi:hypothetical protein